MSAFTQYQKMYENHKPISEKTLQISAAKEEEKKIAAMGLGELKDYACPKSLQHKKDWYMTCVSCDGVNNCKPGRRVLEILENDTKPEEKVSAVEKFNSRYNKVDQLSGKDAYLEAISHEDPIQHYMDVHHVPRSSALERFRRWRLKYPEVAVPNIERKKKGNTGMKAEQNRITSEKARKTVEAAFTYPEGVFAYFIKELGINIRSVIRGRVYNWSTAYPDLNEKYNIKKWVELTRGIPGKIADFTEPEGFLGTASKDVDDDISVDEFLAEMDNNSADIVEETVDTVDTVDTVKAEATIQENKTEESEKDWKEKIIEKKEDRDKKNRIAACLVFSEKRKEIAKNIDEIETRIRQEQKRLSELRDDLLKLDSAAKILGFVVENPVATDGFLLVKHHDYGV